jgi:hypothetical protein
MKRGELSMEVIIIAAIALLVLVILSILIIRAGTTTGEGSGCAGVGGMCTDGTSCDEGYGRSFNSCPSGQICCVAVTARDNN